MSTQSSHKLLFPELLERSLLPYIKQKYLKKSRFQNPWNDRDVEYFSTGVMALNENYTTQRLAKAKDYFKSPVFRSGYLSYYLPVNFMKVLTILNQSDQLDSKVTLIKVADIGAGPLTASLAFVFHVMRNIGLFSTKIKIEIDAYDLNADILKDGEAILRSVVHESGLASKIQVRVQRLQGNFSPRKLKSKNYSYIFSINFLNEIAQRSDQIELVGQILQAGTQKGAKVLFLEPGTKKVSRDLQAMRDQIIADTDYRVLAPCLHQKQCPLNLTAKADWCHFKSAWSAPGFIRDFDEAASLTKNYLMYSYLFVQNGKAPLAKPDPHKFVAISDVFEAKGRQEIVGCGALGRIHFIRSHRDKSESNHVFGSLYRGQKFRLPDFKAVGPFRLDDRQNVKKGDHVKVEY